MEQQLAAMSQEMQSMRQFFGAGTAAPRRGDPAPRPGDPAVVRQDHDVEAEQLGHKNFKLFSGDQ